MRYIILLLTAVIGLSNPANAELTLQSIQNILESEKLDTDFINGIHKDDAIIAQALSVSRSMFHNIDSLKPETFIENLQKSNIIERVYNRTEGYAWDKKMTDDVVIELDHNFYALSLSDQKAITDLLAKSYNQDHYLLKDAKTQDIVGQITKDHGLNLF